MPLDDVTQAPPSQDWGLNRTRGWKLKMCWAPKKCFLTTKPLWGKWSYYGENWITGPGEPVVQEYWIERNEFLVWQLKK